jgi:threonine dehydrogenase-like Zn-dependent dehydrogenase
MRDRELTLHAPAGWSQARMDATLQLLADGVLTTEHLITHRFPASRAAEAFELILSRSEPFLGVVLDWE